MRDAREQQSSWHDQFLAGECWKPQETTGWCSTHKQTKVQQLNVACSQPQPGTSTPRGRQCSKSQVNACSLGRGDPLWHQWPPRHRHHMHQLEEEPPCEQPSPATPTDPIGICMTHTSLKSRPIGTSNNHTSQKNWTIH